MKSQFTERDLLIELSKPISVTEKSEFVVHTLKKGFDRNYFWKLAKDHKQISMVKSVLDDCGIELDCPEEYVTHIDFLRQRTYNQLRGLAEIAQVFGENKIDYVVFKGPALATCVYSRTDYRPFGDIDLLVSIEQAQEARNLLMQSLGFKHYLYYDYGTGQEIEIPLHFTTWLERGGYALRPLEKENIEIDLHHNLLPLSLRGQLDTYEVLKRSTSTQVKVPSHLSLDIRVMDHADQLLHLCAHLYKEAILYFPCIYQGYDINLRKFVDINWFIGKYSELIDWNRIEERTREFSLEKELYYSLHYTAKIFKTDIPQSLLESLSEDQGIHLDGFQFWLDGEDWYTWNSSFIVRLFDEARSKEAKNIVINKKKENITIPCPKDEKKRVATSSINFGGNPSPWQLFGSHLHRGEQPRDEQDLSCECSVVWDEEDLIFDMEITDDVLVFVDQFPQGALGSCDMVRLFLGTPDVSKKIKTLGIIPVDPTLEESYCIDLSLSHPNLRFCVIPGFSQKVDEVRVKTTVVDKGYALDIRVPFQLLGVEPTQGKKLTLDLEVDDCDCPRAGTKTTLIWAGGGGGGRSMYDRSVHGILVLT